MRTSGHIFIALSALAVIAGITYALLAKELAGGAMLSVFSVAMLYVGITLLHAGPFDRAEVDENAEPEIGPEHMMGPSWWPFIMALGAGAILLGLKFAPIVLGIGAGIFLVAAVGWFVQISHQAHHGAGHGTEEH